MWLLWLDHRIRSEFEGKRWLLPARVYASPTEIYVGRHLSIELLEKTLQNSGYRPESPLISVGRYRKRENVLELKKRSFDYWDGNEPSINVRIEFRGNKVVSITSIPDNTAIGGIRLEPQLIGKIYPRHNEDRILIPYKEVPPFLISALIAVEDRKFFSHSGVDLRGIARAMLTNIRQGGIRQGGSTLTQQLVKNFFLNQERTYWRKFNEMLMAFLLEYRYSKADILSAYINEIYLGQHGSRSIHGFGTAAEFYFGKPLQELRQDQIALLVGMVKGASFYNPFKHPERSVARRNLILELLGNLKYEDAGTMKKLTRRGLNLTAKPSWSRAKYPAFLDLVRRQLLQDYKLEDLRNEGLRIFTSLQPLLQDQLESVVESELLSLEKSKNHARDSLQTAIVVLHPGSGEVVAISGGRNKENVSFNRALDAKRPLGSLIKPLVYYLALRQPEKYNVLSPVNDSPVSLRQASGELWNPKNYDRKTHENVNLLGALSRSYNQATVRLGLELGVNALVDILESMGLSSKIEGYPSLLLGALDVSPYEVAQMYQSFANGGFQIPSHAIREVLDSKGTPLHRYPLRVNQVLEPAPAFLVNFLLTQVVSQGTGRALVESMPGQLPMAGKTGTTNDLRDNWFAGFGDDLLAVVWIGKDDNSSTKLSGASGAMKVWSAFMKKTKSKKLELLAPEEINWLPLMRSSCQHLDAIPYINGYQPETRSC
ncbi:MAG: penicillin-binding protein 1B [Gammaproteobacteria bacterium]|nr:penicillin-binding protein 1B [Gammaproteobacteria bacterium]